MTLVTHRPRLLSTEGPPPTESNPVEPVLFVHARPSAQPSSPINETDKAFLARLAEGVTDVIHRDDKEKAAALADIAESAAFLLDKVEALRKRFDA